MPIVLNRTDYLYKNGFGLYAIKPQKTNQTFAEGPSVKVLLFPLIYKW